MTTNQIIQYCLGKLKTIIDAKLDKTGTAASANKLSTGTTGSATQPVYISNGVPAAITGALSTTYGGTGRTDGKAQGLATSRQIALIGAVTGSAYFDGTSNISIKTTGGGSITYIEGEVATGDTWFDGKPIYRFVWRGEVTVSAENTDLFSLDDAMDTLLHINGSLDSGTRLYPILYVNTDPGKYMFGFLIGTNAKNVQLKAGTSQRGTYTIVVIMEYTKDKDGEMLRPRHAMTANSSQNCVASASTINSSSYPAWHGFDETVNDSWCSTNTDANRWLQLKMDVALKNIRIEIYSRNSANTRGPESGKVSGSNDGSIWTQIGSFSGWDGSQAGALLGTIQCNNSTAFSYVRVNFDSWDSGSGNPTHVGNMKIFGKFGHYVTAAGPGAPEGPEIFD